MPELLTTADLSTLFHVDGKTAAKWCRAGRFPHAFQVNIATGRGRAWLIPAEDLAGFVPPRRGNPHGNNQPEEGKE